MSLVNNFFRGGISLEENILASPIKAQATVSTAGGFVLGTTVAADVHLQVNSSDVLALASTGATVTGTLSLSASSLVINSVTVSSTGTQLNYLNAATGTTGTTSTNLVFSASPTFTGTPVLPTPFTIGAVSMTATGTQLNYLNAATGTTGTTSTNVVFSTSPTLVTPVLGVASATSLGVLSSTLYAIGGLTPDLQVHSNSNGRGIGIVDWSNNGARINIAGAKSNAIGTFTALGSGDALGFVNFMGADGSTIPNSKGAQIKGVTTQAWSTTTYGAKLEFYTTPNGNSSNTLALTLNADQSATFAGTVSALSFSPTSTTVPTNGLYLAAANIPSIAANSTYVCGWSSTQMEIVKTLVLTAGQIQFPAYQNASSDANTLDDYEENTYTATVQYDTPSGQTQTVSAGWYTKIGRLVTGGFNVTFSPGSSTGGVYILLPFATLTDSNYAAVGFSVVNNGGITSVANAQGLVATYRSNTSRVDLKFNLSTTAGNTALLATACAAGSGLSGSFSYIAAT